MLLQNLRARMNARLSGDREAGFTLIELLVVMLILGILAAIAIPAFFNQRDKATDAQAKSMVRSAQTAIETFATDNGGSYAAANGDPEALSAIEDTIVTAETEGVDTEADVYLSAVVAGADTYTVTATSPDTGNTFDIERVATGVVNYTCETPGNAGCPTGGDWAG
ncbi:MAG TPA: type II secretion system protein [Solirubrobacterales bacterium]|nr:type II secretion system protein [Solirubrobacterales bacterium]